MDARIAQEVVAARSPLCDMLGKRRRRGDAEIGFDALREVCLDVIDARGATGAMHVARPDVDGRDPAPSSGELASVLAAHVIYHYVREGGRWRLSRDRKERLYPLVDLISMLEALPDAPAAPGETQGTQNARGGQRPDSAGG